MKEMGKWRKAGAEQSLPQRPHLNKLLLSPRSLLRPRGLKGPWHQLGPRVRRSRVRRSRPPQRPGRRKTRVSSGRSGGPNCPRDPSRRPARGPSSAGGWGRDSGSDIRRSFPSPRHSAHLPGHPRSGAPEPRQRSKGFGSRREAAAGKDGARRTDRHRSDRHRLLTTPPKPSLTCRRVRPGAAARRAVSPKTQCHGGVPAGQLL